MLSEFSKRIQCYIDLILNLKTANQQVVLDSELGELLFPKADKVMAPFISRDGIWEKEEVDWLKEHVAEGSVCINVGANVGYFALQMARLTGPHGFVYAFEPNREVLPFLKKNISNSEFRNIRVFSKAASNQRGLRKLYLNRVNYGDSRMFDPRSTLGGGNHLEMGFSKKPKYRFVRVTKIDDDLKGRRIDTVLIDTQGFDHLVIRGMKEIISQFKPNILTEFVPQWISDMGWDPLEILEEYQNYGYQIKSLDFESALTISPKELLSNIEKSKKLYSNLSLTQEIKS
jgi:FkbM family methyltransferase